MAMSMTGERTASGARPRVARLAALVIMTAAAGISILLFSATDAIGGGVLVRVAPPSRMLLIVLVATGLLHASGLRWSDVGLSRPKPLWRVPLLVVGGYLLVGGGAAALTAVVLPRLGLEAQPHLLFAGLKGNTGEYLYWLIPVAWGSAAFGEELVFRGFIQSQLTQLFGGRGVAALLAALLQAVIFGVLHAYQGLGGALIAGFTGCALGLVYIAGGRNLWACILLHGLIDSVSLTAIYLGAVPSA